MADYAIHDTTLFGISDVIRKKDGTSALIDPADYEDRIDLMGMLEEKTASGSVVAFADGADDVPLKSCEVTISPTLDGISSVDVVHGGKNLVSNSASAWESGTINSSGNNVSGSGTRTIGYYEIQENAQFIISGIVAPSASSDFRIFYYDKNKNFLTYKNYSVTYLTTPANARYFRLRNVSVDDISTLQIEYGDTATTYAPYVTPTTHTADWEQTIYGGSVDIVNGTGTDEWCEPLTFTGAESENWLWGQNGGYYRANITVQNIAYTVGSRSECFCNLGTYKASGNDYNACFIYGNPTSAQFFFYPPQGIESLADFKTWLSSNNLKMTAPKATPESFTFDPVEIRSLLGSNTMWADSGASSVVYRGSGTQTIIQPTLISKTISQNGTYSAEDDNADGYDEVTVNVPSEYQSIGVHNGRLAVKTGVITESSEYCYTDAFECPSGAVFMDLGETSSEGYLGIELLDNGTHNDYWYANSRNRVIDMSSYYSATKSIRLAFRKSNIDKVVILDINHQKIYSLWDHYLLVEEESENESD